MLRYLGHGPRRYDRRPIAVGKRGRWEFQGVVAGAIAPVTAAGPEVPRCGRLWIFPPDEPHGWTGDGADAEVAVFHFAAVPEAFATWVRATGHRSLPLGEEDRHRLGDFVVRARRQLERPTVFSELHFAEIRERLCVLALRGVPEPPLEAGEHLARLRCETALAWYEANLHRQPRVAEVAAAIHVSPAHLRRQFALVHGRSPQRCFKEVQLRRAQELLRTTAWPQERIAAESGYRELAVFSRCFRRHVGETPGVWRRAVVREGTGA